MIVAGLTSDNMFIDDALYEADVMAETLLCSAVHTLGSLEMTSVEYDMTSDEGMTCSGATIVKHVVSLGDVRASTFRDATIQSVLHILQEGFPNDARPLAYDIRPFFPPETWTIWMEC